MKLFYRKYGQGKSLIILHGLLGLSDNWVAIARALAVYYTVYLPDLRNHGASPQSEEFSYSVLVEDLKQFIIDHNIEAPIIIGHSMGGKLAMKFVLENNIIVEKLIIIDVGPKAFTDERLRFLGGVNKIPLTRFKTRREIKSFINAFIKDKGFSDLLLKNIRKGTESHYEWKFNLDCLQRKHDFISSSVVSSNESKIPSLFIKGGMSDFIDKNEEQRISEMFPLYKMVSVSNAGHWVHVDNPKEFLKIVLGFLN